MIPSRQANPIKRHVAFAIVALAVLAALLAGCSKPGDRLVGTWNGTITIDDAKVKQAVASGEATREGSDALFRTYGTLQVQLDVFTHGEYQMMLGPLRTTGSWAFQDGNARFTPSEQGEGEAPTLEGAVSEDWNTLTLHDPSGKDLSTLVFERG